MKPCSRRFRLLKRDQPVVRVEHLDGEAVLVQQPPRNRPRIRGHHAERPVARTHRRARVEQRVAQLRQRPRQADVGQVRRQPRPASIHAMTRRAVAFAFEDCPAARRVAHTANDGRANTGADHRHVPQVTHDLGRLLVGKTMRRHRRARNASLDDRDQVGIGRAPAKLTAGQLDAGNLIASGTVTSRAAGLIQARAVLDVGGRVAVILRDHLAPVVRRQKRSDRGGDPDHEDGKPAHEFQPRR